MECELQCAVTEISYNAVDGGPYVSRTLDGRRYSLRLKLRKVDLSVSCCKLGWMIYRQQIDQVELEHYCSNMC